MSVTQITCWCRLVKWFQATGGNWEHEKQLGKQFHGKQTSDYCSLKYRVEKPGNFHKSKVLKCVLVNVCVSWSENVIE